MRDADGRQTYPKWERRGWNPLNWRYRENVHNHDSWALGTYPLFWAWLIVQVIACPFLHLYCFIRNPREYLDDNWRD